MYVIYVTIFFESMIRFNDIVGEWKMKVKYLSCVFVRFMSNIHNMKSCHPLLNSLKITILGQNFEIIFGLNVIIGDWKNMKVNM